MDEQQSAFKGFGIVEIYGHSKAAGYISTEYFGSACLFRVDTPELPAREYELEEPAYIDGIWRPKGSKVARPATPARTEYVGPGAIFRLHPCTEEAMLKAVEGMYARPPILLSLPEGRQIPEKTATPVSLIDPVCGVEVEPDDAAAYHVEHEGDVYCFCGPDCRREFLESPTDYVSSEPQAI